ncbi:MAG: hypothetical protein JNM07_02305 [Phycisphaerae bacterium]|nr:hypothetical protein [Phycisphaerae bacterium]
MDEDRTGATPTVQPARPATVAPKGQRPEREAHLTDRESDASSIRLVTDRRRLGAPVALQGLSIATTKAEFSRFTRLAASPRNPIFEIVFDRKGIVKSIKPLRTSGWKDIDEPLLSSIFAWRASGRVLDELPGGPDATVRITMTILMH